jgi:hydrogenase expression/formation protein HypC
MCLAIPGLVVELTAGSELATVDVLGVRRRINVALLESDGVHLGDWVLIHVGFAMTKIDEAEARATLALLEEMGGALDDERGALKDSSIE